MFFECVSRGRLPSKAEENKCFLQKDNWDDFSFKTTFVLFVADEDGKPQKIGPVKIMTKGMKGGYVEVPDSFDELTEEFCSLGQEQNYYEAVMALPTNLGAEILRRLRDCVADQDIWAAFQKEEAMVTSLLRDISSRNVENSFRNIIRGAVHLTPYRFTFVADRPENAITSLSIEIDVVPEINPPTNVHVLIGRNGVGKTRLLAGIANALMNSSDENIGISGEVQFPDEDEDSGRFANLVTVAFSAFDKFGPISQKKKMAGHIRYSYIGLKKDGENKKSDAGKFKNLDELSVEFQQSLDVCLTKSRHQRWSETMRILNADPGFAELELDRLYEENIEEKNIIMQAFDRLSSGHKIVLLTATRLVELVDERTLVLIDEPECHLHPPLLSSLIRALSNLLILRNGVALVATHSPVVLQEVPQSCVWVIRREGVNIAAERPSIETFGENVGILTREVFQLEVTKSGFHQLLSDSAETLDYDGIVEDFNGQIGGEGRAIALVLTNRNRIPH